MHRWQVGVRQVRPAALCSAARWRHSTSVEVEQKFVVPRCFSARVAALRGAVLAKPKRTIEDVYFDAPDFRLTLADAWLRRRQLAWEMKVGAGRNRPGHTTAYVYDEIEGEEAIAAALSKLAGISGGVADPCLQPLMRIVTHRESYTLDGLSVDIDTIEGAPGQDDYVLAEVEAMAASDKAQDVAAAQAAIQKLAKERLGFSDHELGLPVLGKLSFALQQQQPGLYQQLVRCNQA